MRSTKLLALRNMRRLPEIFRCAREVRGWGSFTRRFIGPSGGAYPYEFQLRSAMRIRLNDWADVTTAWAVFCRREYSIPKDAKLIVDLGANIGLFTLFAAIHAPRAKLVSVEPFPATFERLVQNVERNGLSQRVQCIQAAVAATGGVRQMDADPTTPNHSRALRNSADEMQLIPVHAISLDDIISRAASMSSTIDLLKMDIEGVEHEILQAATPALLSHFRLVQLEYHGPASKDLVFEPLLRAGFNCTIDAEYRPNCGIAHFCRN